MSRLKEVAIGQHTDDDVRSAVAKLTEVQTKQTRFSPTLCLWAGEERLVLLLVIRALHGVLGLVWTPQERAI